VRGRLYARVEQSSGGSRVAVLETSPPLAAKILAGPLGPELVVVGSAAGLLEGDHLEVDLDLEPGTSLTVRTTAATLAHPCPGGGATTSTVTVTLGVGARLAWLPEPLVACAGCRHRSTARVELAPGAAAVWYEACTLGRSGEQAGFVDLRLDVNLAGDPLLRDGLRAGLGSGWPALDVLDDLGASPAVLGGRRHVGGVHLLGLRPAGPPWADPPPTGVMALAGPGATARAVATDAASLSRQLAPALSWFVSTLTQKEVLVHG
jgi:urease accessory protein